MLGDPEATWKWGDDMISGSQKLAGEAAQFMKEIHSHLYQVPMPDNPKDAWDWFGPDYHHLSEGEHKFVAKAIVELLQSDQVQPLPSSAKNNNDPSWGQGDLCFSWYKTGSHKRVKIDGGTIICKTR